MQIKRGSTRVALIAFGLVFKFPTLRQRTIYGKLYHFFRGLIANITEAATFIRCQRAPFLVPVVSLGILNIQRFEVGEPPTWEYLDIIFGSLSDEAKKTLLFMDKRHPLGRSNFRLNNKGLRMIDYGDDFGRLLPLSAFLAKHHEELSRLCAHKTATATID